MDIHDDSEFSVRGHVYNYGIFRTVLEENNFINVIK